MHKRYRRLAARLLSIVMAAGMSVSGVSVSVLAAEASDEYAQEETVAATEPEDEVADAAEPELENEVADAAELEPEIEEDTVTLEAESVPAAEVQNDSSAAGETSEKNETPENGWYQINGLFKYYIDGEPVQGKVIEIGGVLYGFDYSGYLQSGCAFELIKENTMNDLLYYRAHISGQLYVNEWYVETDLFGDSSYYYYGEGGVAAFGMLEVAMPEETDAHLRCFEHGGRMKTNSVYTDNNGIQYLIDSLGIMTVDFYPTEDGYWDENGERYYVDGEPVCDAIIEIHGDYYAFDENGFVHRDEVFSVYDYDMESWSFYCADADGKLITNGWFDDGLGNRYYFGADRKAVIGIREIEGNLYSFTNKGILVTEQFFDDEQGNYYYAGSDGICILIEAEEGWNELPDGNRVYFRDGVPVQFEVIKIGSDYFGFNTQGVLYTDRAFTINGDYYRAKEDGRLYVNEWAENGDDRYYYFEDGKAKRGPQTVDSTQYVFALDGRMLTNTTYIDNNGTVYSIDGNGIATVISSSGDDGGWNGDYFYINGEPVCDAVIDIDGKFYGFDSDGRLYRNRAFYLLILPTYVFYRATEDGSLIVNDWYEDENGNKYYYGEGGAAPSSGLNSVDGITYYFFNYGQILLNSYYIENETGDMYHADETGAAEKVEAEDGWVDFEDGQRAYFRYGKPVAHEVITDGGRYYGFGVNGIMHRNATFVITTDYYSGPSYYRAHEDGHLYVNEWAQDGDDWYYYFDAGKAKAGLFNLGGKLYVFTAKGLMRKNENYTDYATGNQYVIGSDGVARRSSAVSDGWVQSGNLYYFIENGRYIKGQVKKIGGTYYGFDYSGIMYDDVPFESYSNGAGSNYRAKKGGALYANSWYEGNNGSWYYYGADAKMAKGWNQIGGKWYYFDSEGRMAAGQQEIGGTSYFFKDSGVMATGWQEIEGSWYYFGSSGAMVKENWQQSGNAWYYFDEDGEMVTGLQEIGGTSYFFKDSGAMATGWQEIEGSWYYFGSSGAMVRKNWQQSGNAWYYFDEDGEMVTGLQEIGGKIYFFKDGGAMATGWQQVGNDWYCFESGGAAACSKWVGNYYMLDSGVMATNQWVDNDRYYVGADGLWIPDYKEAI